MDYITFGLLVILIFIPASYLFGTYFDKKKIAAMIDLLPGPPRYPIFGTSFGIMLARREEKFDCLNDVYNTYQPLYRTWMGNVPVVHLTKPEHIEVILNSSSHTSKGSMYRSLMEWLGEGLLTAHGEKWHRNRKLITPTFHFKILEQFQEVFEEKSRKLLRLLDAHSDSGEHFDVYPFITHCALDIICETAMGIQINAMEKSESSYVKAVYEVSEIATLRHHKPWLHNDYTFKMSQLGKNFFKHVSELHAFTNRVLQDRKQANKSKKSDGQANGLDDRDAVFGTKKRLAFLDLLIEASDNGRVLTDTDIRQEIDTFMFEGHDTTTAGICWTLFLLGNYPEIQEKVAEELEDIFVKEDRPITLRDLGEMKYLERVIKESLRLYPSVPFISRTLSKNVELDGLTVPESCPVLVHIYHVHRDTRNFPDPEKFDPDRFLPENAKTRHPFSYIPFSAGPRNCIGQKFALNEEKTLLASIIRKYKVRSLKKQEDMRLIPELILRPLDGIRITLTKRE